MTDMFKVMDPNMLKTMMKNQAGMDVSDAQLESMRSMMTPEMLQNFSKMDMSSLPGIGNMGNMGGFAPPPTYNSPSTTVNTSRTGNTNNDSGAATTMPAGFPGMAGMPGMNGMDIKPDQIQMLLDMLGNNPEMLKGMVGMLGENNPVAGFVKNKTPEQLGKYVKWFKRLFKAYTAVSPVINFIRKYFQLLMGLLIGYIVYRIFLSP